MADATKGAAPLSDGADGAKPSGDSANPPASPAMAQFLELKRAHPDSILFYRMGDFYELFFDDAVKAAAALGITLTKRGKHAGKDVPMCGVPVHAADTYLLRLIRKGFRVAVCEQMEDPAEAKKRGAKAVVHREVVRIVTPGTITEDELLESRRNNFLAALAEAEGALGLAWLDVSTGEFSVQPVAPAGLAAALARIDPGELLAPERVVARAEVNAALADWMAIVEVQPDPRFDSESARRRLEAAYGIKALDALGAFSRAEIAACGALVDYVELTQKGRLPRLDAPRRRRDGEALEIDAATRRNLELTQSLAGEREGSLLAVIDRTVTGPGARLMAAHLAAPLTDPFAIARRLDMVAWFHAEAGLRDAVRDRLRRSADVERALCRLTVGRAGPRDIGAVRDALGVARDLRHMVADRDAPPTGIAKCADDLGDHLELIALLGRALVAEPPARTVDGGFIAEGYSDELDETRTFRDEGRRLAAGLQKEYAESTGIASLKVRHNNVLGYFIEVTAAQDVNMPKGADGGFIHRQTLASAVRYTTTELAELEGRIARAGNRVIELEHALFEALAAEIARAGEAIARAASALAALDVAASLAELAVERRYVRPEVVDGPDFEITGGRHPVVEAALAAGREADFVPNDCSLAPEKRLWLVTGPNMAGKSTFLRQNALIVVLAQAGSFVPAGAARIGVVDRLFSRVGAADDLARGRSTFMVEMVETAAILNQASPRSLVILDEIGRGTATFDGLSIAWATLEHLHETNRCRTLFATHFHELTNLKATLDALSCHTMRVKEWQGQVVFLHEVEHGEATASYGIHVGRLAGLPDAVVRRAQDVLGRLEKGGRSGEMSELANDLPLFSAAPAARSAGPAGPSAVDQALAEVSPDELTAREALDLVYRLKRLADD
jgi:DNA mismatch repair protein MutS